MQHGETSNDQSQLRVIIHFTSAPLFAKPGDYIKMDRSRRNLTDASVALLSKSLPNCRVVLWPLDQYLAVDILQ